MLFRPAAKTDAHSIAALHTANWQSAYRGMFSDHYLDEKAPLERRKAWTERLDNPADGQWTMVVEEGNDLLGFICIRRYAEPEFGGLLDNLHVRADQRGRGIGKQLMQYGARWMADEHPGVSLFLYVLVDNSPAIKVYEKLRGKRTATLTQVLPGDNEVKVYRYVWDNPATLYG